MRESSSEPNLPSRRLLIVGLVVALSAAAYFALPLVASPFSVASSLRAQKARNDAALPFMEAIKGKIRVGDASSDVTKVFAEAGITATYNEFDRRWEALHRTGPQSGVAIHVYVDNDGRVVRSDFHAVMTGP